MRKLIFIALIVVAAISINATFSWGWGDCEKDNGEIVRKEISIDQFNKLHVSGSPTVYLRMGNSQKVEIETTQNIIDLLKTSVTDGEWKIGFNKCLNLRHGVKFYIDATAIEKLSVSGSGDIISKNTINSDDLTIQVRGSGDIKLDVNSSKINSKVQGSGDISLSGKTEVQNISIQGSGDYSAMDLTSNEAEASVNGSGDIKITVKEKLRAKVNGSGDIMYYGNPANVDSKVNGSGDITAK